MLTLSWPNQVGFQYAKSNFTDLQNLQRQTEYNRKDFREYVSRNPFNIENEHVLVGLLQQLSINVEWTLDFVVEYTKLRANSLCTLFKIINPNSVGGLVPAGFYREGVNELWTLVENTRIYKEGFIDLDKLQAVIPLYSTVLNRGYKHPVLRSKTGTRDKEFAIIGVDLVELAVGWWAYMKLDRERDTGISAYVCQYPMVNAQLVHNQMSVINILYEFFINEKPLSDLIETDTVSFNTLGEERLLKLYLNFFINWSTGRTLEDLNHLLSQYQSLYRVDYTNFVRAGKFGLMAQTCWVWELPILKIYALYLSIVNRMDYKASDINIIIERAYPVMKNNYQRIPNSKFKAHFLEMLELVNMLNKENMKK